MDGFKDNDIRKVVEADKAHVWHHLTQHKAFETADPRIIVEGKGLRVWDANGKEYLDAVSGAVWTVSIGYGREDIVKAIADQLMKLSYFAGAAGSVPAAIFAEKLIEKMPGMSRVYFANSGSEANEKAFKMVRQISHKRYGGKKYKILYRDRDYHGGTIGTMSAGGQDERCIGYGPFPDGFVRVPHCHEYRAQWDLSGAEYGVRAAEAIEEVILREGPETVGALCLETITAGGAVILPPEGYWPRVQEICDRYDILLHIDEVVCGVGRTGTWFGYEHYGIRPDFVTLAKGVAGGYAAMGVTVTTEKVFEMFKDDPSDRLSYFRDISTFGGCTAGPAAGIETLRIIEEEGLLENCTAMGARALASFEAMKAKHAVVGDVRGKGLLVGMELVTDRDTKAPVSEKDIAAVVGECAAQGVLIGAANRSVEGLNNTLCIAPALVATADDIDQITDTMDRALTKVFG